MEIIHKNFGNNPNLLSLNMENEFIVKRFIAIRKELGFTQAEFANRLGITSTTADIERGRTKLSGKVVAELLKQFKVNPLWLKKISLKLFRLQ